MFNEQEMPGAFKGATSKDLQQQKLDCGECRSEGMKGKECGPLCLQTLD